MLDISLWWCLRCGSPRSTSTTSSRQNAVNFKVKRFSDTLQYLMHTRIYKNSIGCNRKIIIKNNSIGNTVENCLIRVRFFPEKFYLFSVHFIVNELRSSHFLTFEIFVKISSLKSLANYYPEIRKIFRLSQNSTKFFWVTRFRETNLMAQSVSSSEI